MLDSDRRLSWFTKVMVGLVAFYLVTPTLIVIPLSFTNRASFDFPQGLVAALLPGLFDRPGVA